MFRFKMTSIANKSKRVFKVIMYSSVIIFTGLLNGVNANEAFDDTGINLAVEKTNMSGQQQIEWVEEQLGMANKLYEQVNSMLEKSRAEKETLKITCLDDKVAQIHVSLRGVEDRIEDLKIAEKNEEKEAANQNFAILKIYISRIQGLKAEAENCLGESDIVFGETETITTISGDITIEDPSQEEIPEDFGIEQPVHASGFF